MSAVITRSSTAAGKVSSADDVDHLYCCDENESICGLDISESQEVDTLLNLCIVCDDLDPQLCERCGQ